MTKITTLKPRIGVLSTSKARTLDTPAGGTKRLYGDTWGKIRHRILVRDKYTCKCCGMVSLSNEVDHINPLHMGGSNDDVNLQTLCTECHKAKTAGEARTRWGL